MPLIIPGKLASKLWVKKEAEKEGGTLIIDEEPPTEFDDVHVEANRPSISINSPSNGATINSNSLDVQVSVSAPRGISRVEYYLDNKLISTVNAPFNLHYFISNFFVKGYHTLRAVAYDDVDNSNEAKIDLNLMIDLALPSATLFTPQNGSAFVLNNFPIPVGIKLNDVLATDKVEFFQRLVGSSNVQTIGTIISPLKQNVLINWLRVADPGEYDLYGEIISGNKSYQTNVVRVIVKE